MRTRVRLVLLTLVVAGCGTTDRPLPTDPTVSAAVSPRPLPTPHEDPWYRAGREALEQIRATEPVSGRAKNVILFVGDGLGIGTVTAGRILEGQLRGQSGEENVLSFERLPYTALCKTYNVNAQVPDSAGTATAMMTGVKAYAGVISVDQDVKPLDHTNLQGNTPRTLIEIAERWGMSTGVISTSTITDATPAAAYAHSPHRDWQNDARLSEEARAAGFPDIARQLVEFPHGNGLEVAMGGGRRNFFSEAERDPEHPAETGSRKDGRNLINQWLQRPRSAYVWNLAQFHAVDPASTDHLLGLFDPQMMKAAVDRPADPGGEPSLAQMVSKAIDLLSRNPNGFALVVEDEWIDEAHHKGNAYRALHSVVALAEAVEVARQKTGRKTLIVVTGDHSHQFAPGGRAVRGNPILGKVIGLNRDGSRQTDWARDRNQLPYTSLLYGTGPGHRSPRPDLTNVDTEHPDYIFESAVSTGSEYHGMDDVPVYAGGAGAHRFRGVLEQNVIFHLILAALTEEGR
jgi:alkaline phosphatase